MRSLLVLTVYYFRNFSLGASFVANSVISASANKVYMFYPTFVCLSVRLAATSRRNYETDLHEHFTRDVSLYKNELVTCWNSSASGIRIYGLFEEFFNIVK